MGSFKMTRWLQDDLQMETWKSALGPREEFKMTRWQHESMMTLVLRRRSRRRSPLGPGAGKFVAVNLPTWPHQPRIPASLISILSDPHKYKYKYKYRYRYIYRCKQIQL